MPLSSSQRASLVESAASRPGTAHWPLTDLTLKQFALPAREEWSGNTGENHFLEMIDKASDQALIELAQHLGFEFEVARRPTLNLHFGARGFQAAAVNADLRQNLSIPSSGDDVR